MSNAQVLCLPGIYVATRQPYDGVRIDATRSSCQCSGTSCIKTGTGRVYTAAATFLCEAYGRVPTEPLVISEPSGRI